MPDLYEELGMLRRLIQGCVKTDALDQLVSQKVPDIRRAGYLFSRYG